MRRRVGSSLYLTSCGGLADDAAGVETILRPDGRVTGQINVRPDAAARPQRHVAMNDRKGADLDRGIQLGARADDGRGMDHYPFMR